MNVEVVSVRVLGNPQVETVFVSGSRFVSDIGTEESYCPDCYDCNVNCEECDT